MIITDEAMYLCGKYPAEYYGEDMSEFVFFDNSLFIVAIVISVVIIGLYLLAWFMSKNHKVGWLIFALVFFSLDTIMLLSWYVIDFSMILDILFHAWVLYYLISGISAHYKWLKLPDEETETVETVEIDQDIAQ